METDGLPSARAEMAPTSSFVRPLLTDMYQISMAYAYWKAGRHDDPAVFDLFFRNNPFEGEYTVFAGLNEVIRFTSSYGFNADEIDYLRKTFPHFGEGFLTWLSSLDGSRLKIYAVDEGSVVFPRVPIIRVEGPLALAQLMETTFLVLVNYASLVATNAARHRVIVGDDIQLLEFGLRRAQGPDGGMSASRYSYIGGFNATSNVAAGQLFGIEVRGTHAHSLVTSFTSMSELEDPTLIDSNNRTVDFVARCIDYSKKIGANTNESELAAFISFAQAFPSQFLALIDTYNTLTSGLPNFLAVALALYECGYKPIGIRLDSGDLAYFSNQCRAAFRDVSEKFGVPFENLQIVASNDINEDVLQALKLQGHSIDCFGVGTHLVTCQKQPALGCVYKLVEVKGKPRIKVSADLEKMTIPGRKDAYRIYNSQGMPVIDLLCGPDDKVPEPGCRIRCHHPTETQKRCDVIPARVEPLIRLQFQNGIRVGPRPSLVDLRCRVREQVRKLRPDHVRYLNPTPYKVSLTAGLFSFMQSLWDRETPVEVID